MKNFLRKLRLFLIRSYARGVWTPLLCAAGICLLTFGFIIVLNFITFAHVPLGRIIELMLDPGAFESNRTPAAWFQFGTAIFGAVVFTSLVITTISNMFTNLAEEYRNGEFDVDLKGHTLILGTNRIFYNSLNFIHEQEGKKVVLTTEPAKDVRSKIASYIGRRKADDFIIVSGDRRFANNLDRVSYEYAKRIYILGETTDIDHDAANIFCIKELCKRLNGDDKVGITIQSQQIECILEIDDTDIHLLTKQTELNLASIALRCFNPDEILARKLLLNKDTADFELKYLDELSDKSQHLIIIGTSRVATEIAKVYLKLAHYPNYTGKKKRTKLTIIDQNESLDLGNHSNLKDVCHVYEYGKGDICTDTFKKTEYDDFLDFEINHIKGELHDAHVLKLLESLNNNDEISFVIASNNSDLNFKNSISLPCYVYQQKYPVFVYQPVAGLVIENKKLPSYYKNLQQFGLSTSLTDLYEEQEINIRRATIYADLMVNDASYAKRPDKTDEELDFFFQRMKMQMQDALTDRALYIQYMINIFGSNFNPNNKDYYFKGMHLSWIASKLLGEYRVMPKALWETFNRKLAEIDCTNARIALKALKDDMHLLYNLTSYERLDYIIKEFDTKTDEYIHEYLAKRSLPRYDS